MISVPVYNRAGQQVSTYEIDPEVLSPEVNKQLLHDAVVMYEANRRMGTVQTKGRSDVAGSKKKLYKQKGTGRARMGPKRSPIRRGGGHAHHKEPQDWGYRLNKKAVKLATRMALRSKFDDNQVTILEDLTLSAPKTKDVASFLKAAGLADQTCLLAIADHDPVVWKSARNIEALEVSPAADLNAYVLLKQRRLIVTKAALDKLTATA